MTDIWSTPPLPIQPGESEAADRIAELRSSIDFTQRMLEKELKQVSMPYLIDHSLSIEYRVSPLFIGVCIWEGEITTRWMEDGRKYLLTTPITQRCKLWAMFNRESKAPMGWGLSPNIYCFHYLNGDTGFDDWLKLCAGELKHLGTEGFNDLKKKGEDIAKRLETINLLSIGTHINPPPTLHQYFFSNGESSRRGKVERMLADNIITRYDPFKETVKEETVEETAPEILPETLPEGSPIRIIIPEPEFYRQVSTAATTPTTISILDLV